MPNHLLMLLICYCCFLYSLYLAYSSVQFSYGELIFDLTCVMQVCSQYHHCVDCWVVFSVQHTLKTVRYHLQLRFFCQVIDVTHSRESGAGTYPKVGWSEPKKITAATAMCQTKFPSSCDWQHLSCDACLEVRGEIIRTVLCCIVYWSCALS